MILQIMVVIVFFRTQRESQIEVARHYGESVATSIKLYLTETIDVTMTMEALYLDYHNQYLDNFSIISKRQMDSIPSVKGIYFSQNGVIKYAYPRENAFIIGFDVLADEEQKISAQKAIDTGEITISGPHNLAEGGEGFIIRNPIFDDGEFVGFAIVVLDREYFCEEILDTVDAKSAKYDFGVWNEEIDSITDEFGYILKNCDHDVSKRLDITIDVPNSKWHLNIEPESGWISFLYVLPIILGTTIVIIILINALYRWMIGNAKRLYEIEHDELTGLLTRQAFYRRVDGLLKENPNKKYEILAADIENFKMVNSVYGEAKGDEVLKYLADCYRTEMSTGICARYGGDQFVCFYPSEDGQGVEHFLKVIKEFADNAPVRNLTVKYGHYSNIDTGISITEMFDRALLAARSIKNDYGRVVENYEGQVSRTHLRNQMLESGFEDALKAKEFKVWYQPKFDAKSERLVGAEALVRWIQNDGTVIPPGAFIPLFEQDGIIVKVDEYVFRNVCETIKKWEDSGLQPIPISVNLSRSSLYTAGVIERYVEIVKETGISTEYVPIELTESAELHSVQIKDLTEKLKNAGFKLHMDDFGAGFSSLASLNILPFDVVKLDKSIIDFIGDAGGEEIIRHIIQLSHFKKMKVVAEGVEKKDQLTFLRENECDYIQGYYYSPPKPEEDFLEFVKMY